MNENDAKLLEIAKQLAGDRPAQGTLPDGTHVVRSGVTSDDCELLADMRGVYLEGQGHKVRRCKWCDRPSCIGSCPQWWEQEMGVKRGA